MQRSGPTHHHFLHDALAAIGSSQPVGSVEPWRRLVAGALRRVRSTTRVDDDLVGDVVGALFEKLLRLRTGSPTAWRRLLLLEERSLRAKLGQMARTASMDLDPERPQKRALAQLVASALRTGLPEAGGPPLTLRAGDRLSRTAVAAAVAWALALPDGPARRPYAIACFLLRRYHASSSLDAGHPWPLPDAGEGPAGSAEHREHAGRVATALEARLAPQEVRALALQLRGETLETIASDLGCQRTKAQGLAARARKTLAEVVAQLEAEWQGA